LKSVPSSDLYLAKIGGTFGVKGLLRLRLESDFPEFFAAGRTLKAVLGKQTLELTIDRFDSDRLLIGFSGFNSPEEASRLTNCELFTTIEETKAAITLKENERFWFELIGASAAENGETVAKIVDIQEGAAPLLVLETAGGKSRLAIPYNERYIVGFENGVLRVRNVAELIGAL
jgi:16S rRNA processing protein RimM